MRLSRPTTLLSAALLALAVATGGVPAGASAPAVAGGSRGPSAEQLGLPQLRSPRSFTGFAFDRCVTPSSSDMDTWRTSSPFAGVGVYISGNSRGCPDSAQPYLSPQWVADQHRQGWRILGIHVGFQAPCFEAGDPTPAKLRMSSIPSQARRQGTEAATEAVARATYYGLGPGSTLYLDIEWYDRMITTCNQAVLTHVDAWTDRLHVLGYRSGLYSSASAAIAAVDLARTADPQAWTWPDQLWFAWGNGRADLEGLPYLSDTAWRGERLHQYELDVAATYGGTTLTIDRNWLSVGNGSRARRQTGTCGTQLSWSTYPPREQGDSGPRIAAARCLLLRGGYTRAAVGERLDVATVTALRRLQRDRGLPVTGQLTDRSWVALLSGGSDTLVKIGSNRQQVWRLQRALRAAGRDAPLTGVFDVRTATTVKAYQAGIGQPVTGVADWTLWRALAKGRVGQVTG
jgi:hypothetical protein